MFHKYNLRLLPITSVHFQGPRLGGTYTDGYGDAGANLTAVLRALGGNSDSFPCIGSPCVHYTSFAMDCEDDSGPVTVSVDYLHGWLERMKAGITDSAGTPLYGWSGVYNGHGICANWNNIVSCFNSYGIRPDFIWIAGYPDGSTIPSSPLPWNTDGDCDTDNSPCYVALGQSTVLWQYAGDALIAGEYVDLDQGNPNLDFHTALGQYCPYP